MHASCRGCQAWTVARLEADRCSTDGTNYVGWQRQAEGVSIQGLLEEALAAVRRRAGDRPRGGADRCRRARTRAGGQRAHAAPSTTSQTLRRALNAVLPADVRVLAVEDAAPGFMRGSMRVSKTYEYRIANAPFVSAFRAPLRLARARQPLDVEAMRRGAEALVGRHDFAAFQSSGGDVHSTERTILRSTGVRRGQTGVRPGRPRSTPARHPRHRRRLPAPHGPQHRRHAGRRRVRPLAGRATLREILAGRDRAARRAAPPPPRDSFWCASTTDGVLLYNAK